MTRYYGILRRGWCIGSFPGNIGIQMATAWHQNERVAAESFIDIICRPHKSHDSPLGHANITLSSNIDHLLRQTQGRHRILKSA